MSQTDRTNYSKFITPDSPGERVRLRGCEVHVVHHDAGEARGDHTHEETHVVFVRSGRMRWGVDGEIRETGPGDTIVTPGGVPHSYEVLGGEPARVVCLVAPPEAGSEPGHE
ncbi:cupin domain-containing protein [Halegenticoccus soli]|uniref:cupin domain-containing protein n=1 Tax=Halegenticoccus soli TaxID=1985678 RepID=UPI000C6DB995|nr:cupin domain-containing protein [Halegenticoccus soli]